MTEVKWCKCSEECPIHGDPAKAHKMLAEIAKLRATLTELRRDPKLWKSGGAGGQDRYAGLPPGMRLIDEALKE